MKLVNLIFAVALNVSFSSGAYAGEWSLGGLIGQSSIDTLTHSQTKVDDNDVSVGIDIAYDFSDVWGVEIGYIDFGVASFNTSVMRSNFTIEGDASAIYLAGRGTFEIATRWSLTGKIGVASLDTTSGGLLGTTQSQSSEEIMLGASVDYAFSEVFSAGLRFDTISDGSSLALGLRYRFGN